MTHPVRPQRPTPARAEVSSVEWLFEPFWRGERLIVGIAADATTITDDLGMPAAAELRAVGEMVRAAVRADGILVDGVWTAQPSADDATDGDRHVFVAVDLLELEGESLLDVPLQERRRLLASVIDERAQVRISPAVKQPIGGWLGGWRDGGFTHFVAKHQNARYAPGERNDDWLKIRIHRDEPVGFVARLTGSRERVRRIRD